MNQAVAYIRVSLHCTRATRLAPVCGSQSVTRETPGDEFSNLNGQSGCLNLVKRDSGNGKLDRRQKGNARLLAKQVRSQAGFALIPFRRHFLNGGSKSLGTPIGDRPGSHARVAASFLKGG